MKSRTRMPLEVCAIAAGSAFGHEFEDAQASVRGFGWVAALVSVACLFAAAAYAIA